MTGDLILNGAPTADNQAATKAYVDGRAAGSGAVRYDAAQTLEVAQQFQARKNINAAGVDSPQFKGYVTLTPENENIGIGVGLSPSRDGNNYALDISDVNEGTPTLLTGVKTPTDADTNAAATVEYVNAKVASSGVTVDAALNSTSTNPVQNKAVKAALDRKAGTAVATTSANGLMSKDDKAKLDGITGQVTAANIHAPEHTTDLVQYGAFQIAAQQIISQIPTVPDVLPNPKALVIKIGSTTVTYDGSTAQTVTIADGSEVSY